MAITAACAVDGHIEAIARDFAMNSGDRAHDRISLLSVLCRANAGASGARGGFREIGS
jgi:hypothetical protein